MYGVYKNYGMSKDGFHKFAQVGRGPRACACRGRWPGGAQG